MMATTVISFRIMERLRTLRKIRARFLAQFTLSSFAALRTVRSGRANGLGMTHSALWHKRRWAVLPRQKAVFQRIDQLAVDKDLVRLRRELERIAGPDGEIRVLAHLDRPYALVDSENLRRVDGHGLERRFVGHPVMVDDGGLLDVVALLDNRIIRVQADQHALFPEDISVLRDGVPALDLESPGVGEGYDADVPPRDFGRNHVGVERVMQRRNLEMELVSDAEQRVKVVHLVRVDVEPHLAREHLGKRLELEVALRRGTLLAAILPGLPLGDVVLRVEEPLADDRGLAHQGGGRLALAAVNPFGILAPRPLHAKRSVMELDLVQRLPAVELDDGRPA